MKHRAKFSQDQQQNAISQESTTQTPREFASPEEMLRFDASITPAPPSIATRLQKALAASGSVKNPWWKKWLRW